MQLCSFLPWSRNHYNGYTKQFQEPYAYGEQVPTNCRRYVSCANQDDNDGLYYTVPRPKGHDERPAPPRELAEASGAWAQPADARRG